MNTSSSSGFVRGCVFIASVAIIAIVAFSLWFAFGLRILAEQWSLGNERVLAWSADVQSIAVAAGPYEPLVHGGLETSVASHVEVRKVDGSNVVAVLPAFAVQTGAFSSDNRLFATGGKDGVAQVWQLNNRALLYTLQQPANKDNPGYVDPLENMTFSDDNQVIMANESEFKAHIWRVSDGALLRSFPAERAALHPNGQIIATQDAATDAITLWRVADGQQLRVFTPANRPRALAFSPDGQWLAVGSLEEFAGSSQTGFVEVWAVNRPAPQPVSTFIARGIAINALAWSPDSRMLAAAGGPIVNDSVLPSLDFWPFTPPDQIHLWRMGDGAHLQTLYGPALQLQFSADGQQLYAVNQDTLYRWRIIPWARWLRWGLIGLGMLGLAAVLWRRRRRRAIRAV